MAISNEELRKQLAEALKAVISAQAQTQSLAQISALRKALEAAIPLLEQPPPPPVGSPGVATD